METILKNKKSLAVLVVILLLFYIVSLTTGGNEIDEVSEPQAEHKEIENTANELSGINFDQSIFSAPGYRSLVDFSPVLAPQPVGRRNPFDIIGRD